MPRTLVLALLLSPLVLFASPARAFWCNGYLVLEGDRMHEVRERCGEPASVVARTDSHTTYLGGGVVRGGVVFGGSSRTTTVAVEIWVYDFGRTRFMEELRFEDGVLRTLTRLGRGTRRTERDRAREDGRSAMRWVASPLDRGRRRLS